MIKSIVWTSLRRCQGIPRLQGSLARGHLLLPRRELQASSATAFDRGGPRLQREEPSLPGLDSTQHQKGTTASRQQEMRENLFYRFLEFIKGYQAVLDRVLPSKVTHIYKLFLSGSKMLFRDMREFGWIYSVLSRTSDWEKACRTLSRKQLELYMTLPNDLFSVAPVLLISSLPLMQNVVFPEVRKQVDDEQQAKRHKFYKHLLRDMQKRLERDEGGSVGGETDTCKAVVERRLLHGHKPTVSEILSLIPLFVKGGAFHLQAIPALQVRHLMKVHGLKHLTRWRHRLQQHGNLVNQIDRAIHREGIETLSDEELTRCCLVRGLDANGLLREEMLEYLGDWVRVSKELNVSSMSLLLHLPVFLSYKSQTANSLNV